MSGEQPGVPPMKKLEDLIHLAELCVDLLQQNEEHYAEVMWNRKFFPRFQAINIFQFLNEGDDY